MTAYYNEIDPKAAEWLRNLIALGAIAPGVVDERSIEDVRPDELAGFTQCHFFAGVGVWSYALRQAGWGDDRPVWTGSCPCQPFSAAGKRTGLADERHLWPAFFHLIQNAKPGDVPVLGEQVASPDGLAWLDVVQADLEGAGYTVGAVDTCAAGFAVGYGESQAGEWLRRAILHCRNPGIERMLRGFAEWAGAGNLGYGVGSSSHIRQRLYWVADTISDQKHQEQQGPAGDEGKRGADMYGRCGAPDGVAGFTDDSDSNALGESENGRHIRGKLGNQEGSECQAPCGGQDQRGRRDDAADDGPNSPHRGHADWFLCRDGKWRCAEPGSFPLVDGASFALGSGGPREGKSRAAMLKGYGNAINADQATAFIRAVIDTLPVGDTGF